MRIYFDTEFTGLHQDTTLISIGCVTEGGDTFYAELTDFDRSQVSDWVKRNVLEHLTMLWKGPVDAAHERDMAVCGSRQLVAMRLREWFAIFGQVEMWSDVLAYDWVLLLDLLGNELPENVNYIPRDLATAFALNGIDPDINREEFAGNIQGVKHNALHDAHAIKACCEKIVTTPAAAE